MEKKKILETISEVWGIDVDENTSFADVSSLRKLQIIMALDEEGIKLPIEKLTSIKSVADLLKGIA